jgi:hypothetical protein
MLSSQLKTKMLRPYAKYFQQFNKFIRLLIFWRGNTVIVLKRSENAGDFALSCE